MIAALTVLALIVSSLLTAFGLCALIGANDAVTRANRRAEYWKARATHPVDHLGTGSPLHDELAQETFRGQLDHMGGGRA